MIKVKTWNKVDLKGDWIFSFKIDGVRAIWDGERWLSRKEKPLYHIPKCDLKDVEVFTGSFKDTIQATKTHEGSEISLDCLYNLNPLDVRLLHTTLRDPTVFVIENELKYALNLEYEGLVLRQGDVWLKVKPIETYDVPILAVNEGKGKFKGMLGSLTTPLGSVGTGFTNEERKEKWNVGDTIEVSFMHFTSDGKFRHPRFVRLRPDK